MDFRDNVPSKIVKIMLKKALYTCFVLFACTMHAASHMAGGFSAPQAATQEVLDLVAPLRATAEQKAGVSFKSFKPVSFRRQGVFLLFLILRCGLTHSKCSRCGACLSREGGA